jgi:L-threonylcarbamoyladenylate synthase
MDDYKIFLTEGSKLEYFKVDPVRPNKHAVKRAAELIKAGGIIVYPTDTLYGFGISIKNSLALKKLNSIKGREANKPISLLINDKQQLEELVGKLSVEDNRIFDALLPGKVTLLFRVRKKIDISEFSDLKKIGFRIPDSNLCHELVSHVGGPISSTSVNLAQQNNLSNVEDIIDIFGKNIDLILDSGPINSTKGSTVLDTTSSPPTLLREGDVSQAEIEGILGHEINSSYPQKFVITFVCSGNICRSPMAEGILKKLLGRTKYKDIVEINSAGTLNLQATPASLEAIDVAQDFDIDLSEHFSQHLRRNIVMRAGIIICMALDHYNYVTRRYPDYKEKVFLLKQWKKHNKLTNPSIADPIGHDTTFFERTFNEINVEVKRVLPEIIRRLKQFI